MNTEALDRAGLEVLFRMAAGERLWFLEGRRALTGKDTFTWSTRGQADPAVVERLRVRGLVAFGRPTKGNPLAEVTTTRKGGQAVHDARKEGRP